MLKSLKCLNVFKDSNLPTILWSWTEVQLSNLVLRTSGLNHLASEYEIDCWCKMLQVLLSNTILASNFNNNKGKSLNYSIWALTCQKNILTAGNQNKFYSCASFTPTLISVLFFKRMIIELLFFLWAKSVLLLSI